MYFSKVFAANLETPIIQNSYFWLTAAFIFCTITTSSIFGFIIDFFVFSFPKVYKSGNNRKLLVSSSSGKICIWCGKSLKENNLLNHVGTWYLDDLNGKYQIKIILEQAYALNLNNLAFNIIESLQNSFSILFNIHSFIK